MNRPLLLASLLALGLPAGSLVAQNEAPPAAAQGEAEFALPPKVLWEYAPAQRAKHIQRLIGLDDAKTAELEAIFVATKAANDKLRAEHQGEQLQRRMKVVNDRALEATNRMLGPEMAERYARLRAADWKAHQERQRARRERAAQGN